MRNAQTAILIGEMLSRQLERRPVPELAALAQLSTINKVRTLVTACGVELRTGGVQPYYDPGEADYIQMPSPAFYALGRWRRPKRYCCDLAHELIHASGHQKRLAKHRHFGDAVYSREELIAEAGSVLILHDLGIRTRRPMLPNLSYLSNWVATLPNAQVELQVALSAAQRAAGWVIAIARNSMAKGQAA